MNEDNTILNIALTQGDPNGIGPELILKVLADSRILEIFTPVVFASRKVMEHYSRMLEIPMEGWRTVKSAEDAESGQINLVNVAEADMTPVPGAASQESGHSAFASLKAAVDATVNGYTDAIVTLPIDKNAIQGEEFHFPGHTEYLQQVTDADNSLMILCSDRVRVALTTTHLPISQIASAITEELIIEKLRLLNNSLQADFSIVHPRIAVLALNPHAGDGGLLGSEEEQIIIPAIEAAQAAKIQCYGPYSADGFFGAGMHEKFDGILAMYHDQGLAPFKTIAMDSGVNFTAALPIVRTSPDHGTAADIAGTGVASADSLSAAIYAAIDIARNRGLHAERTANPLRRQYFDHSKDNVVLDLK